MKKNRNFRRLKSFSKKNAWKESSEQKGRKLVVCMKIFFVLAVFLLVFTRSFNIEACRTGYNKNDRLDVIRERKWDQERDLKFKLRNTEGSVKKSC